AVELPWTAAHSGYSPPGAPLPGRRSNSAKTIRPAMSTRLRTEGLRATFASRSQLQRSYIFTGLVRGQVICGKKASVSSYQFRALNFPIQSFLSPLTAGFTEFLAEFLRFQQLLDLIGKIYGIIWTGIQGTVSRNATALLQLI